MTSAPAHNWTRETGLSLIEILVGISIVAIVAFAVTLSIRPSGSPLSAEADRLAVRLHQAEAEAIASGTPVGLAIDGSGAGYTFYRRVDGRWWPLDDHPTLAAHRLDNPLRLDIAETAPVRAAVAERAALYPAIWFDPAGLTEPFRLRLVSDSAEIALDWQADGSLRREARG